MDNNEQQKEGSGMGIICQKEIEKENKRGVLTIDSFSTFICVLIVKNEVKRKKEVDANNSLLKYYNICIKSYRGQHSPDSFFFYF